MSHVSMPSRRAILQWAGLAVGSTVLRRRAAAASDVLISRKIPSSGEALPTIGLGSSHTFGVTSAADQAEVNAVMSDFAGLGGRLVDSSPMYGAAESAIGNAIGQLDLAKRLFLATKVWTKGREAGIEQAKESMRRMRTRQFDLDR
ncbi:MAG TPA: aldo/keto reductase, partial [Myxococcaceae bacterium]|nr:aldo/keto reductase [Myxococcaceae bacterium]